MEDIKSVATSVTSTSLSILSVLGIGVSRIKITLAIRCLFVCLLFLVRVCHYLRYYCYFVSTLSPVKCDHQSLPKRPLFINVIYDWIFIFSRWIPILFLPRSVSLVVYVSKSRLSNHISSLSFFGSHRPRLNRVPSDHSRLYPPIHPRLVRTCNIWDHSFKLK